MAKVALGAASSQRKGVAEQRNFLCRGDYHQCVASINVIVDPDTTLNVCDVIGFDAEGLVVSLNAYLAK